MSALASKHPGLISFLLLVVLVTGCGSGSAVTDEASPSAATSTAPPAPTAAETPPEELPPNELPPNASNQPPGSVPASPDIASLPDADCQNPETQTAMNQCAKASYDQADTKLNQVYNQLKPSLSAQQQDQLTQAELAWIDFRDRHCEFEAGQFEGGSVQPTIYYSCLAQVSAERTAELQSPAPTRLSYKAADQQLNQVYQSLKSGLSDSRKSGLTTAQLAWLDYRDTNCAYEASTQDCLARMTLSRTQQLEEQAAMQAL
ncbi:MAG: DUF1311 domain-containing protein [Leptolyngbyaceae cyanobacterium SM1_1_3]|nr:DUF1311 domain-containing protein [Leptolyngbyaceae cyanobacterium SM1_1_3]NJN05009.1 DUF1311 domain-containing protein [Leptolyngbyaceae cyanobacterium RM1_1_2]NJO12068.1 DUF1311 domain-containing protein [Leptolyngbyaceae cyanobacterium SL_1_1]